MWWGNQGILGVGNRHDNIQSLAVVYPYNTTLIRILLSSKYLTIMCLKNSYSGLKKPLLLILILVGGSNINLNR